MLSKSIPIPCNHGTDSNYYRDSPGEDPAGPLVCPYRVYRGGGWYSDAGFCRSASRDWYEPVFRFINLGFRVALVPAEQ